MMTSGILQQTDRRPTDRRSVRTLSRLVALTLILAGLHFSTLPVTAQQPAAGTELPQYALRRLGTVRETLRSYARAISLSPDGKIVAVGDAMGGVWLWDARKNEAVASLAASTPNASQAVFDVAFDPTGKFLAAGGRDSMVTVYQVDQQRIIKQIKPPSIGAISRVLFSDDGKTIYAGGRGQVVAIDSESGAVGRKFTGIKGEVRDMALLPGDSPMLYVADSSVKTLLAFNTRTGELVATHTREQSAISLAGLKHEGTHLLAVASGTAEVDVIDGRTGKGVIKIPGHDRVQSVNINDAGDTLITRDVAGAVRFISTEDWQVRKTVRSQPATVRTDHVPRGVALSADGSLLITSRVDALLDARDMNLDLPITPAHGHHGSVRALLWSADGSTLHSAGTDGMLRTWDVRTGEQTRAMPTGGSDASSLTFVGEDASILVAMPNSYSDVLLARLDPVAGMANEPVKVTEPYVRRLALFTDDGSLLLTAGNQRGVNERDPLTGNVIRKLDGIAGAAGNIAVSQNRRWTIASNQSRLLAWGEDSTEPRLVMQPSGQATAITTVAISVDGRLTATLTADRTPRIWDMVTASLISTQPKTIGSGQVTLAAFHPRHAAVLAMGGGVESAVAIWRLDRREAQQVLRGHEKPVQCMAFSPDGTMLATGSDDSTIMVWKVNPFEATAPDAAGIASAMNDLGSADSERAYEAVWKLAAMRDAAVPLMSRVLAPTSIDEQRLARLIAQLDSDRFVQREAASRSLMELGTAAAPVLRVLAGDVQASAEQRTRAVELLEGIETPMPRDATTRAALRAVHVLQMIGSPAAKEALKVAGADDKLGRVSEEARWAIK